KTDLLSDSELATVSMELANFNNTAPIIQTRNAEISFSFIEEKLKDIANPKKDSIVSGRNLPLTSALITFKEPVDKDEFEQWVQSLPDTVYRMKGYVPVKGITNPYLFQYAY